MLFGLKYGSADDVASGRAEYDRWSVLALSRVWLNPRVQAGGDLSQPGRVPGFIDRRGMWRPAVASAAIRAGLERVGYDYLHARPPVWVGQPWQIEAVLSYCDTRHHRGVIYAASGFVLARTAGHIQTWWTRAVRPLALPERRAIEHRSQHDPRGRRLRSAAATLF